jgi:hypothetical protein
MSSIKMRACDVADLAAVTTAPGDVKVPTKTTEPAENVEMQVNCVGSKVPAFVSAFVETVLPITVPVTFVNRTRIVTVLPFCTKGSDGSKYVIR